MQSAVTASVKQSRDDVLIVGAGVIGLTAALRLLREGRGVRVIDAVAVGAGASHGNCGTITPSHAPPLALPGTPWRALKWMFRSDAPLYVKPRLDPSLMAWMARFLGRCNVRDAAEATRQRALILTDARRRLEVLISDERLDCQFRSSGSWYVFHDEAEFEHEWALVAPLKALGISSQRIDGETAMCTEPSLRDGVAGVIEFPGDAQLRPDRLVSELARKVVELGGVIENDCRLQSAQPANDGVRAETSHGERHADWLLLATGAWSPGLLAPLGLKLPLQPGKGYSITFSRPETVPQRPLVLHEASVCVTAWDDGFRLGSTMEFSGYDSSLNRVRLDALERGAAGYLHQPVGESRIEEWYGWRPMMADDLPVIGALPKHPRVLFAGGHGMLGVSMSATTAQLVADQVAGREPCMDASAFSPARFA
ncbi:MAG: FAD-dependent oxidoreductase [Lysobacteraceae bacterium]